MTIIEPNKNRKSTNILFWGSIALLIGVALWTISVYNQTVNLSHEIKSAEAKAGALEAGNAELKNKRYGLMDARELHAIAASYGLIKITHPEYLELPPVAALANR
jgi:hypothetical protein